MALAALCPSLTLRFSVWGHEAEQLSKPCSASISTMCIKGLLQQRGDFYNHHVYLGSHTIEEISTRIHGVLLGTPEAHPSSGQGPCSPVEGLRPEARMLCVTWLGLGFPDGMPCSSQFHAVLARGCLRPAPAPHPPGGRPAVLPRSSALSATESGRRRADQPSLLLLGPRGGPSMPMKTATSAKE